MILLITLYYAVSHPPNAPLQWLGPLSRADCLRLERQTSETWCQPIKVKK